MAVVNAYCTLTALRTHLGDTGSALSTELLERAINASSRAIDHHCGRRFWKDAAVTQRTYAHVNTGTTGVFDAVTAYVDDISTTTGLVIETGTDGTAFPTTWASTDYVLEPRNAAVVASGDTADAYAFWRIVAIAGRQFWSSQRPTLRVTAKFGWSSTPYEVEEACILKAASLFKRKDAPFGVAGFGEFGPVRITRADPDALDLLRPYVLTTLV